MKILQINKFYWVKGGSERYFFDVSKILRDQGHEVVPFAMRHPKNEATIWSRFFVSEIDFNDLRGWRVKVRGAMRIWYSFEAARKLEALLREFKPDIAHLHNIAHQLSPSILKVLAKHRIPVVMTLHDYQLICPNARLFNNGEIDERCLGGKFYHDLFNRAHKDSWFASLIVVMEMYLHRWLKIYERNICRYIAPSEFMRDKVAQAGVNQDRLVFLPHFFDVNTYQSNHDSATASPYIVYVGRLAEEKGVDTLIRAMTTVDAPLTLKIVGSGEEQDRLRALVKELALERRVEFLGYRSGDELKNLMSGAETVIVPSIWYENSPLTVYESFALSKPVIASRVGGLPELVADGLRGYLFTVKDHVALADKINILHADDSLRVRFGREARIFVEQELSSRKHYDKLMAIYQQCIVESNKHKVQSQK